MTGIGVMGTVIAPLLITGYLAADTRAGPHVRTEATSWINTSINLGAAAGSGLLGAAAETTTPGTALAICAAAATTALLVSAPQRVRNDRRLRQGNDPVEPTSHPEN